jgi:Leucine-rich repeat (LRR) protein
VLIALAAWWHIAHPSDERLLQGLPSREAYFVAGQKNSAFSHVVTIRDFSEYNWMEKHRPTLAKLQNSFSLTIGEMNEFAGDRHAFSLRGFDSLRSVRAVHLLRSYIASLEGAENLENIIHFTNQGSAIQDLSWLTRCENLETLVLDSGFLQKYPRPMQWPRLQSLILHVPEHDAFVNLHGCQELRHLAICGEGIEFIEGLETLEHLESVVLHTPNLKVTEKRNAFYPVNRIKHLTLVGCREFRELDLDAFPMLEELELGDTLINTITGKQRGKLKELTIYQGHGIDHLDVSAYPSLVRLTLKHTPVREVHGFAKTGKLEKVVMHDIETTELKDIGAAPSLRTLEVEDATELTVVNLANALNLQTLKIKASSLNQLDHLGEASSLHRLEILDSPIVSLDGMSDLRALAYADLSDTALSMLPSLKGAPLEMLILRDTKLAVLPELGATPCSLYIWGTPVGKAQDVADLNWKLIEDGKWEFVKDQEGYWSYTPIYVQHYYDENGQEIDRDGWPYIETTPAPPSFSPNSMLQRWGLMGRVGLEGAYDYSGAGGWDHYEHV